MRIGELANLVGVPTSTIRFYERTALLDPPDRTASGYRDYSVADLGRIEFIRDAQAGGLTLAQINSILDVRDAGDAPCTHVTGLIDERLVEIEAGIAALEATRRELTILRERASKTTVSECGDDGICVIIQPSSR